MGYWRVSWLCTCLLCGGSGGGLLLLTCFVVYLVNSWLLRLTNYLIHTVDLKRTTSSNQLPAVTNNIQLSFPQFYLCFNNNNYNNNIKVCLWNDCRLGLQNYREKKWWWWLVFVRRKEDGSASAVWGELVEIACLLHGWSWKDSKTCWLRFQRHYKIRVEFYNSAQTFPNLRLEWNGISYDVLMREIIVYYIYI